MELSAVEIIAAIVNFLVLLALLKKFLYKPILGMLEAREKEIEDNLTSAESARQEAESIKAQYEETLHKARTEANAIVEQATRIGEQSRNEIYHKALDEAQAVADKAKREIARERDLALRELRGEVANLAVDVAEKVVGRSVDIEDQHQLVESFIEEVEGAK